MPTFYGSRKISRGKWTQKELNKSVKAVILINVPIRSATGNNISSKWLVSKRNLIQKLILSKKTG